MGGEHCPWIIKQRPGQRINLTLYDFGVTRRSSQGSVCQVYAQVKERGLAADITICGSSVRHKVVYVSETNLIKVSVSDSPYDTDPVRFLLSYEGESQSAEAPSERVSRVIVYC